MRLCIPDTDEQEVQEVAQVLASGYLTQGPKVAEFERLVTDKIGCRYGFAMTSCTTALHLALIAANIQPGDEVLVADFTFPATANVVVQLEAIPVLVDIDLETFTMNVDDLRARITPRSKAIIPVHAFGCAADMNPIRAIAKEHHLTVIEDAACAIGTTYYSENCGNMGDMGCFSFHPRKVITTGEGGMITTNHPDIADRIQLLRNHGGTKTGHWYQYEAAGFNYRLSDIQGAVGIVQMHKLDYFIERRRLLAGALKDRLQGIPGIRIPAEPKWGGHIYQSFVILVDEGLDRDRIVHEMCAQNVETTLGTYALHDQPFFQRTYHYHTGQLPKSHAAYTRTITLPLYPKMTLEDLDLIAQTLEKVIKNGNCSDL